MKDDLQAKQSPNTAYTAHFVRPNFDYAETPYMRETLNEMCQALYSYTSNRYSGD
jgi:hypothetical protein